ncbi:MAG: GPI anchored serine-threonine rich family protein [Acidobacteria bacterium]|jgi:hypothetical protein|nr:GPI anchored serine-threonine rich family protein [Acidobacteriota bacterium]
MHKTLAVIFTVFIATALALPAQSLVITAPNGGETLTLGQTFPIAWTVQNSSQKVKLILFQNGNRLGEIAENLSSGQSPYSWPVGTYSGATAPAGSGFTIRVRTMDNALDDYSNGPFTIAAGGVPASPAPPAPPAGLNINQRIIQKKPLNLTAEIVPYAVITSFTVNGQPQPGNTNLEVFRHLGLTCRTSAISKTQPILYRYTLKLENTLNNLRYLVHQGSWTEQSDVTLQFSLNHIITHVYPDNMLDGHQVPLWLFGAITVEVKNATQSETPQRKRIDLKFHL